MSALQKGTPDKQPTCADTCFFLTFERLGSDWLKLTYPLVDADCNELADWEEFAASLEMERSMTKTRRISVWGWMVAGAVIVMAGCQQLKPMSDERIPLKDSNEAAIPMFRVEMMNTFGGAAVYTGRLEGAPTVQSALEDSGALRRYRSMQIDLFRVVPDKKTVLRLPVGMQPGKRMVRIEQDYALKAGDRIVVRGRSMLSP